MSIQQENQPQLEENNAKTEYSFDVSRLKLFATGDSGSETKKEEEPKHGTSDDSKDNSGNSNEKQNTLNKFSEGENIKDFDQLNNTRNQNDRAKSFHSPGFNSTESLFSRGDFNKKRFLSSSFTGTGGEQNHFSNNSQIQRTSEGEYKGLQSAGSLRKRRKTKATLTTLTPESSFLNKSSDLLTCRLSGSLADPRKKFLFNSHNSNENQGQQMYAGGGNTPSQASKASNEMMMGYYDSAYPIYESPEIQNCGGYGNQYYDGSRPELDTNLFQPLNFSFNEQLTEKQAKNIQKTFKSVSTLRTTVPWGRNDKLQNRQNNGMDYQQSPRREKYKSKTSTKQKKKLIGFNNESRKYGKLDHFKHQNKSKTRKGKRTKDKRKNRNYMKILNEKEYDLDGRSCCNDQRTTLMIRNIPNKYTQDLLLKDINQKFESKYDFFYLPIDFENKCNVGYGFINIIKPAYIQAFYKEYNGKPWKNFNSIKICAIKYARIQGRKENLKHFQGSSVMKHTDKRLRPLMLNKQNIQDLVEKQKNLGSVL